MLLTKMQKICCQLCSTVISAAACQTDSQTALVLYCSNPGTRLDVSTYI